MRNKRSEKTGAATWTVTGGNGVASFEVACSENKLYPISVSHHLYAPNVAEDRKTHCEFLDDKGYCDGSCRAGVELWEQVKGLSEKEKDEKVFQYLEKWAYSHNVI